MRKPIFTAEEAKQFLAGYQTGKIEGKTDDCDHGIDLTFGASMLRDISAKAFGNYSEEQKTKFHKLHYEIVKSIRSGGDWLISMMGQYFHQTSIPMEDAIWYNKILIMINAGTLFAALFPVNKWADSDINKRKTYDRIAEEHNEICIWAEGAKNSDGFFAVRGELLLKKIYDGETPDEPDVILKNNLTGYVETGNTELCKTALTLSMGIPLLRIPYPILGIHPVAAIFYNNKTID